MKKSYRVSSLWGDAIEASPFKDSADEIIKKATTVIEVKKKDDSKLIKSKNLSVEDKLTIIKTNVYEKLGRYIDSTEVITDIDRFREFISLAVKNKIISVDTETNHSLDPITCKLMGLCLYTPGNKQVYVPVNHVNYITGEKLENQITEQQIKEELSKITECKIIMHHGKFDRNVILCTCGLKLPIHWDTMIGSQLLDENDFAGLKYQYTTKIDSSIEKYDIEEFFTDIPYEYVDPNLFSLYAATDAMMTYKLYEYQKSEFEKDDNKGLYKLFTEVEMPVVEVTAQMELYGVAIDTKHAKRLADTFHPELERLINEINNELNKYSDSIARWRKTASANKKDIKLDKSGKPKINKKGQVEYTKSKSEQLEDPVAFNSTTQLAILLYDIIGVEAVNKKKPRSTASKDLAAIGLPLCKKINEYKKIYKLVTGFIDTLPTFINKADGRLHASLNQLGREDNNVVTGRFSSSEPNVQQIPSHGLGATVRLLFTASCYDHEVESEDNCYSIPYTDEVLMKDGSYKFAKDLVSGDILDTDETVINIISTEFEEVKIYVK